MSIGTRKLLLGCLLFLFLLVACTTPTELDNSIEETDIVLPTPTLTLTSTPSPTETAIPTPKPTSIRLGCFSEFISDPVQLIGLWQATGYDPWTVERYYFKEDGTFEYWLEGTTEDFKRVEPRLLSGSYRLEGDSIIKLDFPDNKTALLTYYVCNGDLLFLDADTLDIRLYAPIPEFCWLDVEFPEICYGY